MYLVVYTFVFMTNFYKIRWRCMGYMQKLIYDLTHSSTWLNFWRRNYFFLILAHPVYKMWIIQEPNTLELWNKLHFEEKKTESIYHV